MIFPPWWGYGYFLELHIKTIMSSEISQQLRLMVQSETSQRLATSDGAIVRV